MMERGAIGELIPEHGKSGVLDWQTIYSQPDYETRVYRNGHLLAKFYGDKAIRLERVAIFLTTEQS